MDLKAIIADRRCYARCVYCGWTGVERNTRNHADQDVTGHAKSCLKHPNREVERLKSEADTLRRVGEEIRNCLTSAQYSVADGTILDKKIAAALTAWSKLESK